jgi:hypothetical protein
MPYKSCQVGGGVKVNSNSHGKFINAKNLHNVGLSVESWSLSRLEKKSLWLMEEG